MTSKKPHVINFGNKNYTNQIFIKLFPIFAKLSGIKEANQ